MLIPLLIIFLTRLIHAFPINELSSDNVTTLRANYNFEGIVKLSNCSGSLIRYKQSRGNDRAIVLSNGHCIGKFPEPGKVIVDKADNRTFDVLSPNGSVLGRLRSTKIVYGTLTKTDIVLFELENTYDEIFRKYNVRAFELSSWKPAVNDEIEIISGYWRLGYSCFIEKIVDKLKEDRWTMEDSIRYSRPGCNIIGGTSGSPIILAGSRTVIGVNNTTNKNGGRCTLNNPCELSTNGKVKSYAGYSYGQQTYWVYSCLNDRSQIDLSKKECELHH